MDRPKIAQRLKHFDVEHLSARQQATYERLTRSQRGGVGGPFEAWIAAPELADRAEALGTYLRFGSGLPLDLIEITVLATAARWSSGFVFSSHAPLARSAGVNPSAIEQIRLEQRPDNVTSAQRVALELVTAALKTPQVDDATWAAVNAELPDTDVMNLIAIAGYYAMVCMTVNAYQIGQDLDVPLQR